LDIGRDTVGWEAVYVDIIEVLLSNDFATVKLSIYRSAERPRLRIYDANLGFEITLDPLEIEALTRLGHSDFGALIAGTMPDED